MMQFQVTEVHLTVARNDQYEDKCTGVLSSLYHPLLAFSSDIPAAQKEHLEQGALLYWDKSKPFVCL